MFWTSKTCRLREPTLLREDHFLQAFSCRFTQLKCKESPVLEEREEEDFSAWHRACCQHPDCWHRWHCWGWEAEHSTGRVRAEPAAPPCFVRGSTAVTFPRKVPELEIISTLSSLRPTWPKCETLSPHRIANLDIEFYRCTDTRKEHCRTTVTRQKRLTSKCAMKGKLFSKDMTFYLQRKKHNSTTQESTIYCWLNY